MTEQQLSFEDLDAEAFDAVSAVADDTRGWRGPAACAVVGITYRQLDYWARSELAQPSIATAAGSGKTATGERQPGAVDDELAKPRNQVACSVSNNRRRYTFARRHQQPAGAVRPSSPTSRLGCRSWLRKH